MKAKIKDNVLVIRIPLLEEPMISESGAFKMFARTQGFQKVKCEYDGKPVSISVCAGVSTKEAKSTNGYSGRRR